MGTCKSFGRKETTAVQKHCRKYHSISPSGEFRIRRAKAKTAVVE